MATYFQQIMGINLPEVINSVEKSMTLHNNLCADFRNHVSKFFKRFTLSDLQDPPTNFTQTKSYPMIATLSAFRFFVIVLIYFHHLSYPGGLGPAAVTFFFVLSGFIMAYNYSRKFVFLDAKQLEFFYIKRLCRLYPLYILTFIISIPVVYLTHFKTNLFSAISTIFLLQSYFPNGIQVFAFNSLAWFISDLVLFYFLTPFILFYFHKLHIVEHLKTLLMLLVMIFFCEISLAYLFNNSMEGYTFGWWFFYISPYFRIFDYIIGLVLGLVFMSSDGFFTLRMSINRILFSALEVISILFFVYSFYWVRFFSQYPPLVMGAYFIPFCVFVIFVFSFQRGIISLILSTKFSVYLGGLSFSFYLIHQLAISYVAIFFATPIYGMTSDIIKITAQLLLLFVIICLSDITVRYFEKPINIWLIHKAETIIIPPIKKIE
jgi:peptidoglycan/LPS O-acetylase OafA/YrhL